MDEQARARRARAGARHFGARGAQAGPARGRRRGARGIVSAPRTSTSSAIRRRSPTEAMRAGDGRAPRSGDEQRFDDPTVNALQERVAELLGKEAALFLPSGTMCNAIAFRLHVRPGGDEVILDRTVASRSVRGRRAGGAVGRDAATCSTVTAASSPRRRSRARCGRPATATGRAPGLCRSSRRPTSGAAASGRWTTFARSWTSPARHGLRTHLDGARLMNAVVASGVPAADFAGRLRYGLDRLHQGAGRARRRGAGGVARADRRGVALQADARRRHAPGRHPRRRRPVRARPPRRAPRRGPRQRARASPRASPSLPGVDDRPRRASRRTSSCSACRTPTGCAARCTSAACRSRRWARSVCAR